MAVPGCFQSFSLLQGLIGVSPLHPKLPETASTLYWSIYEQLSQADRRLGLQNPGDPSLARVEGLGFKV